MVENAKIEKLKCDILGDFQTLCLLCRVVEIHWKMSNSVKQCYQTCQYPIRQNAKMRKNETFLVIFKHSELRVQLCFGKTFFSNVTENKSFSGFFSQLCIKHSESLQHFWLLQSIIFRIFPLQKNLHFRQKNFSLIFTNFRNVLELLDTINATNHTLLASYLK